MGVQQIKRGVPCVDTKEKPHRWGSMGGEALMCNIMMIKILTFVNIH